MAYLARPAGLLLLTVFVLLLVWAGGVHGLEADDYEAARWHPIHFKPQIEAAKDEQCLSCHRELLERRVKATSPAGVAASESLAWYQTLDTYDGEQETFHRRHLVTPYAKEVMDLRCITCHQGNDPREETAGSSATADPSLVQRKQVGPEICLMCHGPFNYELMGVPGPWPEQGKLFGDNCLTCHAAIRTHRHQVTFLNAEAIEQAAAKTSDVCFGCHGGRSWYQISYPYPRHPWPGGGDTVPDWARSRPLESEARFLK